MEPSNSETKSVEPHIGRSVSLDHAAALLRASRRTTYNRIREGRLQTSRPVGSSKRVLLPTLLAIQGRDRSWARAPRWIAADSASVARTHTQSLDHQGEETMNVKTQIKAGCGDDSIIWTS